MAVDNNNAIVVAGHSGNDFAVARYNPNGSVDVSFGTDGKVTTDFGDNSSDRAVSLAIQADNKIVLARLPNLNYETNSRDIALARYAASGGPTVVEGSVFSLTDIGTFTDPGFEIR